MAFQHNQLRLTYTAQSTNYYVLLQETKLFHEYYQSKVTLKLRQHKQNVPQKRKNAPGIFPKPLTSFSFCFVFLFLYIYNDENNMIMVLKVMTL